MLPCSAPSQTTYANGCRCSGCRSEHSRVHRERRVRQAQGIPSDLERIDPSTSREALEWMRDRGLRWTQIESLTGFERSTMQRMMRPDKRNVARSTERILLHTIEQIKRNPTLMVRDALLLPAAWTRWQIGALLARGWPSDVIEAEAGVVVPRRGTKVQRKTVNRFDDVFNRWHAEWGPNRHTAVLMWRKGVFPADCYLWEDRDTRAIPGSLHPDLVVEACQFTALHRSRAQDIRALLREHGQWSTAICARTSMRNWCKATGSLMDDYSDEPLSYANTSRAMRSSPWCANTTHDHSVPAIWMP